MKIEIASAGIFLLLVLPACGTSPQEAPGNQPLTPPTTADVKASTNEDSAVEITLRAEGGSGDIALVVDMPPKHGELVSKMESNGAATFTYTPKKDFNGDDAITFHAEANGVKSTPAKATITVKPVNDLPIATDDVYVVDEDATLNAQGAGVTLNDTDADGDPLTTELVTGVAHGTLVLQAGGAFTYSASPDYNGADEFTYRVHDTAGASEIARVQITIAAVNDRPVGAAEGFALVEDQSLTVTGSNGVLGNDSDTESAITASLVQAPGYAAAFTLNADGSFYYRPQANYFGTDSFQYAANDGALLSFPVTVTLAVSNVNDAPAFLNLTRTINEDATLTLTATDSDSATFYYTTFTAPTHGALQVNANSIVYTPIANYNGPDSFAIGVSDGVLSSPVATFNVTVNPVNDAPTLSGATLAVTANTNFIYSLAAVDVDGDALTYTVSQQPANGPATVSTDGKLYYTPTDCFVGTDSVVVQAHDAGASVSATFSLAVAIGTPASLNFASASEGSIQRPLTLTGTNFGSAGAVTLAAGSFTVLHRDNCGTLVVDFPAGISAGTYGVYVDNGFSNSKVTDYTVMPWINALSPITGSAGSQVTLTGQSFSATQGELWVGGQAASITDWYNTAVTFTVPAGLTAGQYAVQLTTTNLQASNPGTLWVDTTPPLIPGRANLTPVWTGAEVIYWGGYGASGLYQGGERYNPVTNTWLPMSTVNSYPAYWYEAVWTGTRFLTWGGNKAGSLFQYNACLYAPVSDSWECRNPNTPSRLDISAVWTGTVMMIYGGNSGVVQTWGNLYNPATDVWTSTSTVGAVGRARYTMVWTGKKVIVVGGQANYSTVIGDTGLYDPVADTWTTGATAYPRQWAHSVWTGKEMVVRGGLSPTSNIPEARGQAYNPQTNQWRDISQVNAPAGAYLAPVVWTGDEMMVWGGGYSGGNDPNNAAGRYNPATDTWAALSLSGAPTFRDGLTSVWTGTEMVVRGGQSSSSYPDDGGRYFPASNIWLPMSTTY